MDINSPNFDATALKLAELRQVVADYAIEVAGDRRCRETYIAAIAAYKAAKLTVEATVALCKSEVLTHFIKTVLGLSVAAGALVIMVVYTLGAAAFTLGNKAQQYVNNQLEKREVEQWAAEVAEQVIENEPDQQNQPDQPDKPDQPDQPDQPAKVEFYLNAQRHKEFIKELNQPAKNNPALAKLLNTPSIWEKNHNDIQLSEEQISELSQLIDNAIQNTQPQEPAAEQTIDRQLADAYKEAAKEYPASDDEAYEALTRYYEQDATNRNELHSAGSSVVPGATDAPVELPIAVDMGSSGSPELTTNGRRRGRPKGRAKLNA